MEKKSSNFKKDTIALLRNLPSEWAIAILLGALPLWLFSHTQKDVDDIVQGLLAIGPLIDYSAYLIAPYGLVFLIKYGIRFRSDKSLWIFEFIHKVIAEIGTGFLTITRTGLGAVFGILMIGLSSNIITISTQQIMSLLVMIFSLTIANCALALGKDTLIEHTNRAISRNSIKFDPRLK
ncbi:hypothetical protein ACIOVC_09710 [Pseudomonas neuropathica]